MPVDVSPAKRKRALAPRARRSHAGRALFLAAARLLGAALRSADRVLEALAGRERRNPACGDLQHRARLRIAPGARFALADHEAPERDQLDLVTGLERAGDLVEDQIDDLSGLTLRQLVFVGQGLDDIGFGHCLILTSGKRRIVTAPNVSAVPLTRGGYACTRPAPSPVADLAATAIQRERLLGREWIASSPPRPRAAPCRSWPASRPPSCATPASGTIWRRPRARRSAACSPRQRCSGRRSRAASVSRSRSSATGRSGRSPPILGAPAATPSAPVRTRATAAPTFRSTSSESS